ncbi:hypothetical protein [Streptomyces sp. NPDC046862]|uniref:hypothetical protein n=1 Tax=Streptomyces sp. NPDC046862 TaxID=3154603 RepID=UPI0034566CDF
MSRIPAVRPSGRRDDPEPARRLPPAARPQLSDAAITSAAGAVRGALKKAARERTTTSWDELQRQLGSALPVLHGDERFQGLARVEGDAADNEPLLVALLTVGDPKGAKRYRCIRPGATSSH